ncbi:MAG: aminopeptidase P family protein [Bacteroidota bacterium]|nr:aminopeptidase P family protein [Bacteroidota bacterium]
MLHSNIFAERRLKLRSQITDGLILFLGNTDVPYNYSSNTYQFRQDSTFSYFFGLNEPNLTGIIDVENNTEYLFGDDIDMEDIIWMGYQPSLKDKASETGISHTFPSKDILRTIKQAQTSGRTIHFLPPYRSESILQLQGLLGIAAEKLTEKASSPLTKAVIKLRSVKDSWEIFEIEKMVDVAWLMHTTAMKMARPGILEREIAGTIEGIALSHGNGVSFPVILSMNGETLHNHHHNNYLQKGRLMLTDAGSEAETLYASDITRTIPVGGRFDQRQKDIYNIVLAANRKTIELTSPHRTYLDVHLEAAKTIASGLKDLGLMKGNINEAVAAGAHALFFPHGLGHMLGLDVHDMEGLGETLVGYDETVTRSKQFGLAYLRFAKKPESGYVLTDEPGIYFIPALIDQWRNEKKFPNFINYDNVESYKDFGGIRIEDDLLVTENGCRILGKPIPKTINEIENIMA